MEQNPKIHPDTKAIVDVLKLAGGDVVGSIRLQKLFYLLQESNVYNFDLSWRYHHFGPYSDSLAERVRNGEKQAVIEVEEIPFNERGDWYTRTKAVDDTPVAFDKEAGEKIKKFLDTYKDTRSVIIELAATAHFIYKYEWEKNPWPELPFRKGRKATENNLEEAKALLHEIGLDEGFADKRWLPGDLRV